MNDSSMEIDGKRYKLINKYIIPLRMRELYCSRDVVLVSPEGTVVYPYTGVCSLCDRKFEDTSNPDPKCCPDLEINKRYGCVQRICVDCFFYIRRNQGDEGIPHKILGFLDTGFIPRNI